VIRLLADQNFNGHVLDGLFRLQPDLDLVQVRDVGLSTTPDPAILECHGRVAAGLPMPGVFLVSDHMPVGQAIAEILLAVHCLSPDECNDIVKYFPL
jgi:hypothetical protein